MGAYEDELARWNAVSLIRDRIAEQPALAQHPVAQQVLGAEMAAFNDEAAARSKDRFLDAVTRRGQGRKTSTRPNFGMSPSAAAFNAMVDRPEPALPLEDRAMISAINAAERGGGVSTVDPATGTLTGPSNPSGVAAARRAYDAEKNRRAANRNRANAFRAANAVAQQNFNRDQFMADMAQRNPRAFQAMMQAQMAREQMGLAREQMGQRGRQFDAELGLRRDTMQNSNEQAALDRVLKAAGIGQNERLAMRGMESREKIAQGGVAAQERAAVLQALMGMQRNQTALKEIDARSMQNYMTNAIQRQQLGMDPISFAEYQSGEVDGVPVEPGDPVRARAALDRTAPGAADEIVERVRQNAGLSRAGAGMGFGANAARELSKIVKDLKGRGQLTPERKAMIKNAVSPELRKWLLSPTTRTDGLLKNKPRGSGNSSVWTPFTSAMNYVPIIGKDEWNSDIQELRDIIR